MEILSQPSGAAPPIIFYDRRGQAVTPDARSIIKPRRGVFALVVAVHDNAVMLAAEACAPDVPELPGGGIEADETLDEATQREWAEEVGIPFSADGPFQRFQHVRGFYADDRNEFWIYDQTFRRYHRGWNRRLGGDRIVAESVDQPRTLVRHPHSIIELRPNVRQWCR
jgi:8-oxo-dGTP pyrophosphatase MutT (NUDIX family)